MDDLKLYGPPGTGKTTSGLNWMEARIDDGADPSRVAFVSYTNAAVNEARERIAARFGLDDHDMPYSRTLHALCKRCLHITEKDWSAEAHLDDFAKEYGYDLKGGRSYQATGDLQEVSEKRGTDAALLQIWDFARHRLLPDADAGWRRFADYDPDTTLRLSYPAYLRIVADYEEWKSKNYLRDFTDLLTDFLEAPVSLPVSVVAIDECQDLSPLLWECADHLFAEADYRATLGDDDQAIYSFSGADPLMMNRRSARQVVKLSQSYRLPRAVAENAQWVIRANQNREPKQITPTSEEGYLGRLLDLGGAPLDNGETWLILVRNWRLLDQVRPWLEHHGLPYTIGGGRYSPWSDRGPLQAVRTLYRLSGGQRVTLSDVWQLAQKTSSQRGDQPGAWVYGAKAALQQRATEQPGEWVGWRDLAHLGMTEWGAYRLVRRDLSLLTRGISQRDLLAYDRAVHAGTLMQDVRIRINTIHGEKGREAWGVVVLLGCTGGTWRALSHPDRIEDERRVAYVAATRARNSFYGLAAAPSGGVYPWELCGV